MFLGLNQDDLEKCLTIQNRVVVDSVISTPLRKSEAIYTRDALCKAIYGRLFDWIIQRVNASISKPIDKKMRKNLKFIGLLDIFGFEIFEKNSFEQLCINYANEKLQQHFNKHMFYLEQNEYQKENIEWSHIQFTDNQECLDLIESKGKADPSIFSMLDEECMIKGTDSKLLGKIQKNLIGNNALTKEKAYSDSSFGVGHYAGEVFYNVKNAFN